MARFRVSADRFQDVDFVTPLLGGTKDIIDVAAVTAAVGTYLERRRAKTPPPDAEGPLLDAVQDAGGVVERFDRLVPNDVATWIDARA